MNCIQVGGDIAAVDGCKNVRRKLPSLDSCLGGGEGASVPVKVYNNALNFYDFFFKIIHGW